MIDEIIENADILLEVLDAWDPMGCRIRSIEQKFISCNPDKKIILVLTKIDLVPPSILMQWKSMLSQEFPTVFFKSSL